MDSASPSCDACDAEPAGKTAGSSGSEGRPAPEAASDDAAVVSLSVGGTVFTTTLGTLCVVRGSYLAALFSSSSSWAPTQHWTRRAEQSAGWLDPDTSMAAKWMACQQLPFIDRSPACFSFVLEYLRCLRYHGSQPVLPGSCVCSGCCGGCGSGSSGCSLQQLRAEAEFYLLPGLVRMCDLYCPPTSGACEPEAAGMAAGHGGATSSNGPADQRSQQQQQQQQDDTDRPLLFAGLTSRQDSGHLADSLGDALPTPLTGLDEIHVTLQQQQQQQQVLPPAGPSLLARAVAAAQQIRGAQQAAWRASTQLQQLAELVLQHLLHLPLQAQQPDLVAALAAPGRGNRLELLLQYYPLGDLRIELECRTVPAGATPAAAAAAAAGAAAAGPGVGVGISGSSPSMLSPRHGWLEQQSHQSQQQQSQQQQGAAQAASAATAAGSHRPPTAGCRASADSNGGSSSGSIALPGPGWGGVTTYHRFQIRETGDSTYIVATLMPGDGQQLQELPRVGHKPEVLRYSQLHKLLVQQAPRQSVAGLVWLLQQEGFAALGLATVMDTFCVGGNTFPGVKSVLTFEI